MKRVPIIAAGLLAFATLLFAQSTGSEFYLGSDSDPWWRPLGPQGQTFGATVGKTRPSPPMPGELFLDMDGATDGGPLLEVYDSVNSEWDPVSSEAISGITDNTVPVYDSATNTFIDSSITDDATTLTLAQGALVLTATTSVTYTAGNGMFAFVDGSATDDGLIFGATSGGDGAIYYDGTLNRLAIDGLNATGGQGFGVAIAGNSLTAGGTILTLGGQGSTAIGDASHSFSDISAADFGGTMTNFGLNQTIGAMTAAVNTNILLIDITNADHTDAGSAVNGILIDEITADAEAEESAILIEAGWEHAISIDDDGSSVLSNIMLGDGQDAVIYFSGTALSSELVGGATDDFQFWTNANRGSTFRITNDNSENSFITALDTGATTGAADFVEIDITVVDDPGAAAFNLFSIDWDETDYTASAALLTAINVQDITTDPQDTATGVKLGTGWDVLVDTASFDVLGTFVANAASQAAVEISGTAPDSDGADVFDYLRITPTIPASMDASGRVTGIKIESMAASTGTSSAIYVDMDNGGAASWDNMLECNGGFNAYCNWISAAGEDIDLNSGGALDFDAAEVVTINAAAGGISLFTATAQNILLEGGGTLSGMQFQVAGYNALAQGDGMTLQQLTALVMDGDDDETLFSITGRQTATSSSTGNDLIWLEFIEAATNDAETESAAIRVGDNIDFFVMIDEALGTNDATTNADKTALTAAGTIRVEVSGVVYHIQLYADS